MSGSAQSVSEAVGRLIRRDPTLKQINLHDKQLIDSDLDDLADCLLAHPYVVTDVVLGFNQLTDETGVKLARYVAASSTVESLDLGDNQLGAATYLAMAAALRVNSSLQALFMLGNQAADQTRIEAAFVEALRLNPDRPAKSRWYLCSPSYEFSRMKDLAEQLGHPSLQLMLALLC